MNAKEWTLEEVITELVGTCNYELNGKTLTVYADPVEVTVEWDGHVDEACDAMTLADELGLTLEAGYYDEVEVADGTVVLMGWDDLPDLYDWCA